MQKRKNKNGNNGKYTWSSAGWERAERLKRIGTPEALEELKRVEENLIEIDDDDVKDGFEDEEG